MNRPLRIGTRGSALALWQANHVRDELARRHGVEAELVRIHTSGDKLQTASVAQIGAEGSAKGIFIKEIEDALLSGTVDIAVHSMKDVPTETPAGLVFAAITRREDPRDCLISRTNKSLKGLPVSARIGTSSVRRQAQLRHARPDLVVADLRGNVDTRMKKLAAGDFDAIVLAVAGVNRLGASDKVTQIFKQDVMLPAVGQGALGIETRADDSEATALAASLNDHETRACITAERALLRELEGGCQVPVGAWARISVSGELEMEAGVFAPDGTESVRRNDVGAAADAEAIGMRLGRGLIEAGADKILRLVGRSVG
ncbi:MAG TPA: hydroxymethylbilane synthase [Candidatus Acidoferrales bacterium]|nr:hydroxymethylbilane synthase [Candidatus Acidoferrales bacterium]